ncbi:MAG: glycosyltransferase family 87 protein [Pseudomonadota bacterium]
MTSYLRAGLSALDAFVRQVDQWASRAAFGRNKAALVIGGLLCGLSIVYLVYLGGVKELTEVDFKYVWYAGEMWNAGESPYDPAFSGAASGSFLVDNELDRWLYPPTWWPLSSGLALLNYETATWLWRFFTAASIAASIMLAFLSLRKTNPDAGWLVLGITLFIAATSQATPTLLYLGQTTMIAGLGLALILYGWSHQRKSLIVAGLVLAMLKPQIGILGVALLGMSFDQWRNITIAGAISLLIAMPAFWTGGIMGVTTGFLDALRYHGTLDVNAPGVTTGLQHIVDAATGISTGSIPMIVMALITVIAMKLGIDRLTKHQLVNTDDALLLSIAGIAIATCFWIPLHGYDLVIFYLAIPVLFIRCPPFCKIGVLIGILGTWRAGKVSEIFGGLIETGGIDLHARLLSLSLTAAGLVFFSALFFEAWRTNRHQASR